MESPGTLIGIFASFARNVIDLTARLHVGLQRLLVKKILEYTTSTQIWRDIKDD